MCKDNNLFFYTVSADICFRDNNLFSKIKKESLAGDSFLFLSLKTSIVFQTLISTETPLGSSSFIRASTTCDVDE